MWAIRFDRRRKGTRKNSRKNRIREQRNTKERDFTRSEPFGIFSKTSIWKQFAGKLSGRRITVRDDSVHKGLRRRIVLVQGFGWYELQDQTWRGRRFWTHHPIMPRIHIFSSKPNPEHMQQILEEQLSDQSWKFTSWKFLTISDLNSQFHLQTIQDGHLTICYPEERVDPWTNCIPKCRTLSHQRGIPLWTCKRRRKRTLLGAVEDKLRATCCGLCCKSFQHQETGCGLYQRFFQPSVLVQRKNHSYDGKDVDNCSCQFIVRVRISFNSDLQNGYKIGASSWSRRTTIWCSSSLGHWNPRTCHSLFLDRVSTHLHGGCRLRYVKAGFIERGPAARSTRAELLGDWVHWVQWEVAFINPKHAARLRQGWVGGCLSRCRWWKWVKLNAELFAHTFDGDRGVRKDRTLRIPSALKHSQFGASVLPDLRPSPPRNDGWTAGDGGVEFPFSGFHDVPNDFLFTELVWARWNVVGQTCEWVWLHNDWLFPCHLSPVHITIIGPVIQVHIIHFLGTHGIEIQIPSTTTPNRNSWVVICRGKNRYVDELHLRDPGQSHEFWITVGKIHRKTKWTLLYRVGAIPHRGNSCDAVRNSDESSELFKRSYSCLTERKWNDIPAYKSFKRDSLPAEISKLVMRLVRHYDQDERETDGAVLGILCFQNCEKHFTSPEDEISRTRIDFNTVFFEESNKMRFQYCMSSTNSLLCTRAIHGHTGGNLIAPELMGHVATPYKWKEFLFHRGCSFTVTTILTSGHIAGGREGKEGRQTIHRSGTIHPDEEEPCDDIKTEKSTLSQWVENTQDAV